MVPEEEEENEWKRGQTLEQEVITGEETFGLREIEKEQRLEQETVLASSGKGPARQKMDKVAVGSTERERNKRRKRRILTEEKNPPHDR